MKYNKFQCASLIGVLISILYFCTIGFINDFVANEEVLQLNDEFDQTPKFKTNENIFVIDNEVMMRTNKIVFDNFVLEYNKYPKELINSLIQDKNIFDKSAINQQIPDTKRLYNGTVQELCNTTKTTLQPQAAKRNSKWIVVINHQDFVQNVPIETCVNQVNMQSNVETNLLRDPAKVMCRQSYSTIRLLVFINKNYDLTSDFLYPSACEPYNRF